jgi:c-di-GMP-binding flagellar brake protein YcgR
MVPEVNQRLTVRLLDRGVELASRVEDVVPNGLAIAAPTRRGAEVRLEQGLEVILEWQTTWGPARVLATVGGPAGLRVPALIVFPHGETAVDQRREFARVHSVLDVLVRDGTGRACPAVARDISGGGLRARVSEQLAIGDQVELELHIPDGDVTVAAQVVRVDGERDYGFDFVDLEKNVREAIVRYVFDQMRRELRIRSDRRGSAAA